MTANARAPLSIQALQRPVMDLVQEDPSNAAVWQEEAELDTIVLIDEENRLTIRSIFLFIISGGMTFHSRL